MNTNISFFDGSKNAATMIKHRNRISTNTILFLRRAGKWVCCLFCVATMSVHAQSDVPCEPFVVANFIASATEGCHPLQVQFIASGVSQGAYNFRWYLNTPNPPEYLPGNPIIPSNDPDNQWFGITGANPMRIFEYTRTDGLPQEYRVWLQVDNGTCYDNKDIIITIYPVPTASFEHNAQNGSVCPPESVEFTATNYGFANNDQTLYTWNFGDGAFTETQGATSLPVRHVYENWVSTFPMPRMVSLTLSNTYTTGTGQLVCSSTSSRQIMVNPQVVAQFIGPDEGCSPFEARFINRSFGTVTSFSWDFGDGSPLGAGSNPQHTFVNTSHSEVTDFTVTLKASNNWCQDVVSRSIRLNPQPTASFNVDETQGCQPLKVTFTNTSNTIAATANPNDTYYVFDYGDGYADTFYNTTPTHTHEFTNVSGNYLQRSPTLTAVNRWNCISSVTPVPITVYPFIKAHFEMEDSIGCAPKTIRFYNGSLGFDTYEYHFGDGATESGIRTVGDLSTSHTYNTYNMYQDVVYNVTLRVTSSSMCKDELTKQVKILSAPTADFRPPTPYPSDYTYPAPPLAMDNMIQAPDKSYLIYEWTWSEHGLNDWKTFSSDQTAELFLSEWGEFDITQTVISPNGVCSDSRTRTIAINAPPVFASFEEVPPGCMPYTVAFVNNSMYANYFRWDFGDGRTSSELNPQHTYLSPGTYTVLLTAIGAHPLPQTTTRTIVVHPLPQAGFDFQWVGQTLQTFNYTNHSTNSGPYPVWYRWDWGDNTPNDATENPTHIYLKPDAYSISLTVGTYTSPVCSSMLTINILPDGEANFTVLSSNVDLGYVRSYGLNGRIITSTPDNTAVQFNGTAELIAISKAGNIFVKWNDGNTDNPRMVTVDNDITYTAIFEVCEECENCPGNGTTTSDFEMSANGLSVFPNPVGNILHVLFENFVRNGVLTLYDMSGKTILSRSVSGDIAQIDLSSFAAGSYILRLVENGSTSAGVKIVKN